MAGPHDLLRHLFEYIREQLKDIDPRGFQISKIQGFKLGPADIAGLPGVETNIQPEGDYVWLKVARLEADNPPKIAESIKGMLKVSSDPNGPVPLVDELLLQHQVSLLYKNQPKADRGAMESNLRKSADAYLATYKGQWNAWAEGEKPRRKTIDIYGDLFTLKHQMEAEETAKPSELVWGIGIAAWQLSIESGAFPFSYPLLTQSVEISIDEKTMALEVRPRITDTRVEMDALVACKVTGAVDVEQAIKKHLEEAKDRPVSPFDAGSYTDVLKLAATNLDSQGAYKEALNEHSPIPLAGEHLVITDSWLLFSRPRSNNFLIEDLKRLSDAVAVDCELPVGPLSLVSPPSDEPVEYEPVNYRGISSRGDYSDGKQPQELYFPLPYNHEQITIVERLERAPGVAVQGPPGTGKTHTIANIICHYLATGKRVLVTSRGEPALEVLQSKIPEDVRHLTVALLTGDREGIRQFQASIQAIQHRVSQLNPTETQQIINQRQHEIEQVHHELSSIDQRIDEIAEGQLSEIQIDGVPMRAQKLAELVVSGQTQHGWMDDQLTLAPEHAPPMMEDEASKLRECRRRLGPDLIYAQAVIPSADDLPGSNEIAELHNILIQMHRLDDQIENGELLALRGYTREVLLTARELLAKVEKAMGLVEQLEAVDGGWPFDLRVKCRMNSNASERQALEALFDKLHTLVNERAIFLKHPVELPEKALESVKVLEGIARGAETGKPFGFISIGTGDAKTLLSKVTVAGLPPKDADDWIHVQRYVNLHVDVKSFTARWNQIAEALAVPHLNGGVGGLRHIEQVALAAHIAHNLAIHYDATLPHLAESIFEEPPRQAFLGRSHDLQVIRDQLLRHLTRADLAKATTNHSALQEKLAGKTGPVSDWLRRLVKDKLGDPDFESTDVVQDYAWLVAELRRIAALAPDLATIREYSARIAHAGAPRLASKILSVPVMNLGEDNAFPVSWRQAWNWARMRLHLENIEAREELLAMAARRRDLEVALSRLYMEVVAKAAWLATKRNASPKVLQALAGYATAIRRIGQGTGPNAQRYRRDARTAMTDAAGAVPCWIMSHAKVSEAMPPKIGIFDLVIVDEASQSDLWALPAIVRGKRILVVGDDKQVSPDAGFISAERIAELKHRFLEEQPYGVEMTPEKSLYDLAARVFAAEQVMLREHFRCVPPIIAYSNRTFYKGGIQPLRIPKATERIDPPLVDIRVEGGWRDRHVCNQLEAETIAEEIEAILEDERFENRTIGVVSLLGMDQAKHIDTIVRIRCPAADLIHRKFECGDARTFQGSERDIMFLSMVVDPSNCRALSGNMFEQRFNVAASRARDRMYLVRSVDLAHLSENDLRLTLLSHFNKPVVADEVEAEMLIDRCESGFEKDVYSHLIKHGYRVIPQVKAGAYRIDMVVEGANDTRLAIECDGDEFHGPNRWHHDMTRQRVLERAGWTFWRCFASTWSLRKDEVFSELLERLTTMGIEPLGTIERAPSLVEKRVWRQKNETKDDSYVASSLKFGSDITGQHVP